MSKPSDERYTPQHVLDVVRAFAPISLDPCTISENPTGASHFLTAADDGLEKHWHLLPSPTGLVYVNSPYSRGQIMRWALKCVAESDVARGRDIIQLVPADPSPVWARMLLTTAAAVAYWHKRVAFVRPDGSYEAGAKQSSAFYYFGEKVERFRRVFAPHAVVLNLRAAR